MAKKRKKLDDNTLEVTSDAPVNTITREDIVQNLQGLQAERDVLNAAIAEAEADLAALD